MSVFEIEDVVLHHPRFQAAGPAASWLWTQCGVWSRREDTEGFIPAIAVRSFGTTASARRLVEAGLWEEADGGYQFLRWRDHMGSPESAAKERKRERDRERMREKRAQVTRQHVADVAPDVVRLSRDNTSDVAATVAGLDIPPSLELPPPNPPQGEEHTPKEKRATALPGSWKPLDRQREYAAEHQLDLDATVVDFRNHHLFRGTLGKDWNRGFDTWLRNAVKFRDKDLAVAPKPKADPDAWMNR